MTPRFAWALLALLPLAAACVPDLVPLQPGPAVWYLDGIRLDRLN